MRIIHLSEIVESFSNVCPNCYSVIINQYGACCSQVNVGQLAHLLYVGDMLLDSECVIVDSLPIGNQPRLNKHA